MCGEHEIETVLIVHAWMNGGVLYSSSISHLIKRSFLMGTLKCNCRKNQRSESMDNSHNKCMLIIISICVNIRENVRNDIKTNGWIYRMYRHNQIWSERKKKFCRTKMPEHKHESTKKYANTTLSHWYLVIWMWEAFVVYCVCTASWTSHNENKQMNERTNIFVVVF